MKKHKSEFVALIILLGVLCYAFYDSNLKEDMQDQDIVINTNVLSMNEVKNKEDITMEMLAIPTEELLKAQEEKKEEKKVESGSDVSLENTKEEKAVLLSSGVTFVEEEETIPYNEIISNQVVNYALKFVGGPYVYGGNSLTNGTDCSGFTKLIFANYGITLPRSAPEQAYAGRSVGLENIMPGDLVVSGYDGQVCHAAIYIGDNKLVHALNSNVGIVVTSLYIMPIIDVRRVA